jgi:hypothetical protein
VGLLAQEIQRGDWDWVGRLLGTPTDEEGLRRYVELIERLASGEIKYDDVVQVTGAIREGMEKIKIFAFGREETKGGAQPEAGGPLQFMVDAFDELETKSGISTDKMAGDMTNFIDLSGPKWVGWKQAIVKEIDDVTLRMRSLTDKTWKVTITSEFSETTAERRWGGHAVGEFQHGGYTGDGAPWEAAGIVHRGEYVISQDMLRKMRQGQRAPDYPRLGPMVGGGGGGVTITGPIHVHGVQNAAQLLDALEREAGRRNKRLVGAMA